MYVCQPCSGSPGKANISIFKQGREMFGGCTCFQSMRNWKSRESVSFVAEGKYVILQFISSALLVFDLFAPSSVHWRLEQSHSKGHSLTYKELTHVSAVVWHAQLLHVRRSFNVFLESFCRRTVTQLMRFVFFFTCMIVVVKLSYTSLHMLNSKQVKSDANKFSVLCVASLTKFSWFSSGVHKNQISHWRCHNNTRRTIIPQSRPDAAFFHRSSTSRFNCWQQQWAGLHINH